MAYGDKEGAVGYLIGEENRGLEYMFIMMNLARFSVGHGRCRDLRSAPTSTRWRMRGIAFRVARRAAADARPSRSSGIRTCAAC